MTIQLETNYIPTCSLARCNRVAVYELYRKELYTCHQHLAGIVGHVLEDDERVDIRLAYKEG